MRLLKSSNNFIQIVLMRLINQAFMLGPKIGLTLNLSLVNHKKKQSNIQNIFSEMKENYQKMFF